MSRRGEDAIVYSSEHGQLCRHCGLPVKRCQCRANPRKTADSAPAGDDIVRVGRTSKGRKGKTVTEVTGVPLPPDELRELARELKQRCGTGGALKDGVIEIQGDHRDVLAEALRSRGHTVKLAGG